MPRLTTTILCVFAMAMQVALAVTPRDGAVVCLGGGSSHADDACAEEVTPEPSCADCCDHRSAGTVLAAEHDGECSCVDVEVEDGEGWLRVRDDVAVPVPAGWCLVAIRPARSSVASCASRAPRTTGAGPPSLAAIRPVRLLL